MKNEEILREAIRVGILAHTLRRVKKMVAKRKGRKAYIKFLKKHNMNPSKPDRGYPDDSRNANHAFNVLDALL